MAILKTAVSTFEATKISLSLVFCFTIKAVEVLFALTISNLSVVYTIVSSCVLSPRTIKFELIVKDPLTVRLLL